MGRTSEKKTFDFKVNNKTQKIKVETFPWEKLDYVNIIKKEFNL